MKVIFGLGNPGDKYEQTRHNAGFMFVDKFYDVLGWDNSLRVSPWEHNKKTEAVLSRAKFSSETRILFAKPFTFMNKTGVSARKVVSYFDIKVSDEFVLVHDDLDIELGEFKVQKGVAPRTHNGVISVERLLENTNFTRVRIGVDNRQGDRTIPPEDYVLKKLTNQEQELLDQGIAQAIKFLRRFLEL